MIDRPGCSRPRRVWHLRSGLRPSLRRHTRINHHPILSFNLVLKSGGGHTRGRPLEEFIAAALGERDRLDESIESFDRRAQQLDPEIAAAEEKALKTEQILDVYQKASDAAAEAK